MAEGNPLVAKAPTDGDGPGPLTAGNSEYGYGAGIGVAESAMDAFNGISNGDWIGGGLGVLSLAGEIASAAIDPFGYLMSSVASFLMEHMQPLKDMLDAVAGDPPVIQSYSETWGNVAKKLEDTQVEFSNAVKNGTAGWTGEAADAYRKQSMEQAEAIGGAATAAGAISTVVMIFGEVVAFVREFIRQLIADAVGKLIAWVMETVFSLGFGTPVVVAQAVTAIAGWAARIADKLKALGDAMRRASPLLGKLADVFEKIIKVLGKIAGKVTGLDVINTRNIQPGGFVQRGGRGGGSGGPDGGGSGSGDGADGDGSGSGPDGDSGNSGDGSNGSDGDSNGSGSGDSGSSSSGRPSDGSGTGSDTPSSTGTRGDGGGSPSTRDGSGSPARSDGGSPSRAGDGDAPSTGDNGLGRSPDGGGSPGSPSPARTGEGGSPSAARSDGGSPGNTGDSGAPNRAPDGGSPNPTRTDTGPAPQTRADTGGSPGHTPDGGSPNPARPDTGGPAPHTRPDGGSPSHTNDPGAPNRAPDGGSPSPTRADTGGGSPSPSPTRADTGGGSPSHTGDGGAPRTHGGDGGGTPDRHTGDGGSPTRPTDSGTTTSGSAPTATPRLGDPGTSHVPSQRGGGGGDGSPSGIPPQGQPVAGGMPPQGAPGGTPGSPGSPGGRPQGGGWTGTPGSPGARTPDTHTPRTPDPHTGPSRGPGQTGPDGRPHQPNQPNQPQPVARGDYGPGTQPHTGTPGTHGPGNRPPGGTGPGNTGPGGPGGRGPGGHSGPPHSPDGGTPGHGPDGHGPRQDPNSPHQDGTPHDRGPDGEPDRPLTPDEVNQRHAEGTPAGSSYHRGDSDMGDLPHRVQPDPDGRYTVDVHVTPDGHARIGNRTYTPEEFAEILRRNGDYDGRPIRLIGCDAGSNDFARRLSRELDTEVMAPSRPAWTDSNGRVFSSDYEIGPDGRTRPRIPPNGEWDVHSPDGTARRASDDGFTPDTSHADKQDVDADSARSRGDDEPPDQDADSTPSSQAGEPPDSDHPNRNPESRQQERELLDEDRQQERRQHPQRMTDFTPESTGSPIPVRPDNPQPGAPRAPRPDEPFPGGQTLDRNRSYEVRDSDGNLRGTYHTDGTGRVTHIDTNQPNVPHRMPDGSPNPDYRANPDLLHAQPNTTYRVEIDGEHQVFRTGPDGLPEPAVRFHRPDFPADRHADIPDPNNPDGPKPPKPGQPFVSRNDLEPNTAYRVHDTNGDFRGTYYTDGTGQVRWADVESGRIARDNPDLANMPRSEIGEVRLVQRADPDADAPPGVSNPADFHGSTRRDVMLARNESFFDNHHPPLEPNSRYVVESEYADGDKVETRTRAVYWTDGDGNIQVAETYRPHNPDLNYPKPNMVYNVDGGRFVYETGPEVGNRHGSRSYDTDTVAQTSNDLQRADNHEFHRRDEAAQGRGGGVEGKEPMLDADGNPTGKNINKYDGGHIAGNQFRGPGELLNMLAQWRSQNRGLGDAGDAHWYAFETDLANFLDPKKHSDGLTRSIEQVDTYALRNDGDRAPHTLQVRWVENVTDADGNVVRTVRIRSFPNVPPSAGGGT